MHDSQSASHEAHVPHEQLRAQAESAVGNAAQIAIIEVFGGMGSYKENRSRIDANSVLLADTLNIAKKKENWRDEVRITFQGTSE